MGVYRLFTYGGTLTNNGLTLGTMPTGSANTLQTTVAGQVNLVNSQGMTFSVWDGTAGVKNDGIVQGGDGVWTASATLGAPNIDNWTTTTGTPNAAFSDGTYVLFEARPGTVTVDGGAGRSASRGSSSPSMATGSSAIRSPSPRRRRRSGSATAPRPARA